MLTGYGSDDSQHQTEAAVIVELKQWEKLAAVSGQDGIVAHVHRGRESERPPSVLPGVVVLSRMLEDYNEAARDASVELVPCAYLHNYVVSEGYDPLLDPAYHDYIELAPVFCSGDVLKLRDFICGHIEHGDHGRVLYEIDSGRLRPSKSLQDALASMLDGNEEFILIDDQKVVFEQAVQVALEARSTGQRHVMIVRGGPGTGKSVVAINLLVRLTGEDMVVQYVSKNSAPRNVLLEEAAQWRPVRRPTSTRCSKDRAASICTKGEPLDAVVADEAHRLNAKSGFYSMRARTRSRRSLLRLGSASSSSTRISE